MREIGISIVGVTVVANGGFGSKGKGLWWLMLASANETKGVGEFWVLSLGFTEW